MKCDIVEYFFNNEQSERNARFLVLKLLFTICGIIRSYDVIFITLASKALHMQGVYLKWATSVIHEIIVRQMRSEKLILLIDYSTLRNYFNNGSGDPIKMNILYNISLRRNIYIYIYNYYYQRLIIFPRFLQENRALSRY